MAIVPEAASDCKVAKAEPATTFPMEAWTPAATDPAAIPEDVNPAAVIPPAAAAVIPPAAAVPLAIVYPIFP